MPVTRPLASDVHQNVPLTNYSEKWLQSAEDFVALRAIPLLPVAHQADSYYQFSRADFFRDEAVERADGTESQGSGFGLTTDTYNAKVYAFHKDVTDRQRRNQDSQVRLEQSATEFVSLKMMLARERLFTTVMLGTSIWATETTTAVAWDAAGDPITEIRDQKRTIKGLTGFMPNKMLMGRATYDAILDNLLVLDRIIGGATTSIPALLQKQRLLALLELEDIHVADSVVNSAIRGATESTAFLVGDVALLYYAPASPSLDSPTSAQNFSWTGLTGASASGMSISRFRMEQLKADRIEGEMAFDYKVTANELGHFWSNTTGA